MTAPVPGQVPDDAPGILSGMRVLEVADETAEYCGLMLAGLGATFLLAGLGLLDVATVLGTLLSDLVLMWIDPRIRLGQLR